MASASAFKPSAPSGCRAHARTQRLAAAACSTAAIAGPRPPRLPQLLLDPVDPVFHHHAGALRPDLGCELRQGKGAQGALRHQAVQPAAAPRPGSARPADSSTSRLARGFQQFLDRPRFRLHALQLGFRLLSASSSATASGDLQSLPQPPARLLPARPVFGLEACGRTGSYAWGQFFQLFLGLRRQRDDFPDWSPALRGRLGLPRAEDAAAAARNRLSPASGSPPPPGLRREYCRRRFRCYRHCRCLRATGASAGAGSKPQERARAAKRAPPISSPPFSASLRSLRLPLSARHLLRPRLCR